MKTTLQQKTLDVQTRLIRKSFSTSYNWGKGVTAFRQASPLSVWLHLQPKTIYRSSGIFHRKNISSVKFSPGFIFIAMTTRQYKLTPFICQRKDFVGLIFILKVIYENFWQRKFSIYGTDWMFWTIAVFCTKNLLYLKSSKIQKLMVIHTYFTLTQKQATCMLNFWTYLCKLVLAQILQVKRQTEEKSDLSEQTTL